MTLDGWRALVLDACAMHAAGDSERVELMAQLLYEQDAARHVLRQKGYGVTGTPWAETVADVPSRS